MDLINFIVSLLPVLGIVVAAFSGGYFAAKKFIVDLDKAREDGVITQDEFIQLLKDAFNFVNIIKHILNRKVVI